MTRWALPLILVTLIGCPSENDLTTGGDATLTLDSPAPATWLDEGTVTAGGDWASLSDIAVNDVPATATGALSGSYTADVPVVRGINVLTASGLDARGDLHYVKEHVLAGAFENPIVPVRDATVLRINQPGIDTMLEGIARQANPQTVADALSAANPLYSNSYDVVGSEVAALDLFVDGVDFTTLDLTAVPRQDRLDFEGDVTNLQIDTTFDVRILGSTWFDPVQVTLYADNVVLTGEITMAASGGQLEVVVSNSDVRMVGFFFDTSLIPGGIEGTLLSSTVQSVLESQIGGMLDQQISDLMAAQLSALDLSFSTELLGKTVTVTGAFADAGVDSAGISIAVDLDVDVPGDTGYPYRGYLKAPGAPPTPNATADLSMSLWDDALNKILFEAWRSGMLDMTLSTDDGSLEPVVLLPLHADSGTITVDAALPPVVVEKDGRLQAQLGEVGITLDTVGSDLGNHLELAAAIFVDLDLVIRNGTLAVVLGTPDVDLMVRDSDWGASNEATTNLLGEVLPVDLLLSVLGGLSFPLPQIGDLQVNATAGRDLNGTHTAVQIDLSLP